MREGGEAVEVVAGVVVAAGTSWAVVAPAAAVLVVDVGVIVFLVVLLTSLSLSSIALAVTVVDALTQVLLVESEAEVALVDLSVVAMGSCRVMT
jgi:membrane-anchored glycerophosphoryl diester phosphodiesterase (GDPDase)